MNVLTVNLPGILSEMYVLAQPLSYRFSVFLQQLHFFLMKAPVW